MSASLEEAKGKLLSLVVRPHPITQSAAFFTLRNGNGLAQFSGAVRLFALPKLTGMVFDAMRAAKESK